MYTLKEVVSDKFILLNDFDLINVEGIKSIETFVSETNKKKVVLGIALYDYLFNPTFKSLIKQKIRKDLGDNFQFKYGIRF